MGNSLFVGKDGIYDFKTFLCEVQLFCGCSNREFLVPTEKRWGNGKAFFNGGVPGKRDFKRTIKEDILTSECLAELISVIRYSDKRSEKKSFITANAESIKGIIEKFFLGFSALKNASSSETDIDIQGRLSFAGKIAEIDSLLCAAIVGIAVQESSDPMASEEREILIQLKQRAFVVAYHIGFAYFIYHGLEFEIPDTAIAVLEEMKSKGLIERMPSWMSSQDSKNNPPTKTSASISHDQMWAAGKAWYDRSRQPGGRFFHLDICPALITEASAEQETRFPILVSQEGEQSHPLEEMIGNTEGHLYLIGEGGIGKTTALFSIMERVYDPKNAVPHPERTQVPLFIELSKAPDTYGRLYEGGSSTFIHRAVYQLLHQELSVKQVAKASVEQIEEVFELDPKTAVDPIRDLFSQREDPPEYILLLDGLNEVSRARIVHEKEPTMDDAVIGMVVREIERMMDYPNVRIILTSRTKEEANRGDGITKLYLSGVSTETVERYLTGKKMPEEKVKRTMENEHLLQILRIPLFLTMFAKVEGDDLLLTRGEILNAFFHQKREKLYTQKSRNTEVDEGVRNSAYSQNPDRLTADMQSFILDFILPEIAWRMVQAGEFHITHNYWKENNDGLDQIIMTVLSDESETAVCGKCGQAVFTDFRSASGAGKSTASIAKELMKHHANYEGGVIGAILDSAVMTLGVLTSDGVEYGFIHHYIRDYFAAAYQINRLRMAVFLQSKNKGDLARDCLTDWKAHPLPSEVRRFIGEALGEAHNPPVCDEQGNWHYKVPSDPNDRNLIKRGFDIYRKRFDGQDGYAVWNLLEILKAVRGNLCGEDFSALDLTQCEANGFALGRRGLAAVLKNARINEHLFMPRGHTASVISASYSPDGRRIVTASKDGTAKVWDANTLQEIGTIQGHHNTVNSAVYSPKGRRIVTAAWDKTAKVWDSETLREIGTLYGHTNEYVFTATFSPDESRIVTTSWDKTARIWDAETLREIGSLIGYRKQLIHSSGVYMNVQYNRFDSAVYSPDGHRILTTNDDPIARVWDAKTRQEIGRLEGHGGPVKSAMYRPEDGRRIVTASSDRTAKVWDADTMQPIGTLHGHKGRVNSAAFSWDGHRIVTASSDGTAKVWDADTLQEIGTLRGHTSQVNSAAYSPVGHKIVTASDDGTAKVWDAETLQEIGTLRGYTSGVISAAYSPDGCVLLTASDDHTAKVWDTTTMRINGILKGHKGSVNSAMFRPKDGFRIVTASDDGTAKVWDAKTLQEIGALQGHTDRVLFAGYSPDGSRIVTASHDGTSKVWNAETLQKIGTLQGKGAVKSAVYSPDGRRIMTAPHGYGKETAMVWDAETLKIIGRLHGRKRRADYATYSPDGLRIVTTNDSLTAMIWDAQTLLRIRRLREDQHVLTSAAYSPDGLRIVTVSDSLCARGAKIWDANNAQEIGILRCGKGNARSSAYSPDGLRIVTAFSDSTTKIWNAKTFEFLHTIHNIPGLEVQGVDLRHLHPASRLSDETKERLYEYGAIVDERG